MTKGVVQVNIGAGAAFLGRKASRNSSKDLEETIHGGHFSLSTLCEQ